MRVLTVRQPWAWAIIHGGKDVENRTRNLAGGYRGPVAIHAGLSFDYEATLSLRAAVDLPPRRNLAFGQIIGVVDLVDVHSHEWMPTDVLAPSAWMCSPWAERDAEHLVLANPRPLVKPLAWRGALGLRELPDYVAEFLLERVAS